MMFTLTLLERSLALAKRKSFSGVVAVGIGPGASTLLPMHAHVHPPRTIARPLALCGAA
jgi:hypothetical protein